MVKNPPAMQETGVQFVAQARSMLCYPVDCSLPGSSVHGILQARILEWVAIPFSNTNTYPYLN